MKNPTFIMPEWYYRALPSIRFNFENGMSLTAKFEIYPGLCPSLMLN